MKSFATLSRDAFKDAELGERYYKTICADIEKTTVRVELLTAIIFDSVTP